MSYVIRNIRPSVVHIPDAGLRLDSGQTAVVETLSPQMEELLANRALEAIFSDPDPPVTPVPVEEAPVTPDAPVAAVKRTKKSSTTAESEQPDDTR